MITQIEIPVIDIREVVNRIRGKRGFRLEEKGFHVLLDTCSIKRIPMTRDKLPLFAYQSEDRIPYYFVLTRTIVEEIHKFPDIIPCYLADFICGIASDILDPEVSNKDRDLIQQANISCSLIRKKPADLMGYNDLQIVSYAVNRARQDLQTLIVSDDTHIARSMVYLRESEAERKIFRKNMFRIGLRGAVQLAYPHINPNNFPYFVN